MVPKGADPRGRAPLPAPAPMSGGRRKGPVLEIERMTVRYGAMYALRDITLTVEPEVLVGLIGPNGAGKSTLIDAVTGFTAYTGSVRFGESLDGMPPHKRTRVGIARTFQTMELFMDLTVRQNLEVAAENVGSRPGRTAGPSDRDPIGYALDLLELDSVGDRLPSELPLGVRKLVSVARAVASGSLLLLLDEPAAGLDTSESLVFAGHLGRLRDSGFALLLVDHDMDLVFDACDHVFVLQSGTLLAEGSPDAIRSSQAVREAYLGKTSQQ
jgi:branched-chain amino acid transport system ATP-binding protein